MEKLLKETKTQKLAAKWMERKQSVLDKCDGHCAYCGIEIRIDNFQIDHLVPKHLAKYYKDRLPDGFNVEAFSNLMPSCCSCNNYKSTFSVDQFRENIESQIEKLRKYNPLFRLSERYGLIECKEVSVTFYFESL